MLRRRKASLLHLSCRLFAVWAALLLVTRCAAPDPAAQLAEARRLRENDRPAEAAGILSRLVKSTPGDFSVRYELALALHAAGKEPEALDAAGEAVAANRSSRDARLLRSDVLTALGRDDEALAELRQMVAADPNGKDVHRRMGMIHAKAGRMQQALNQFDKELAVNPSDAHTLTEVGVYYFRTGNIPEAATRLERATTLDPKLARARQYLGEVRLKQGRHQEGLDLQESALRDDPSNVELLVNHAAALESYGDPHLAEAELKAAVARGLGEARIFVQLGKHYRESLRFDEAEATLQHAIELEPASSEAHFHLAKTRMLEGKTVEALPEFKEANRLAPGDPYPYYYLGTIAAGQGKIGEAVTLLRRSLELDPLNPKAHYSLGQALMKSGQPKEAAVEFARHAELLKRLRGSKLQGVATAD